MTESELCDVCVEPYNKRKHKRVNCLTCAFSACISCHERYNLSGVMDDPHCMNCKQLWDTEFIVTNLSRATLNQFKLHKQIGLIQIEKARLPETQYYLQYDKHINTVLSSEFNELTKSIIDINIEKENCPYRNETYRRLRCNERRMRGRLYHLQLIIQSWKNNFTMADEEHIPEALRNRQNHITNTPELSKSTTLMFIYPCPRITCKGFVMKSDWKCGVCFSQHCKLCHMEITSDGHVCEESNVLSATFIIETSHPCPSCATRIHKISGCDQMWCTHCNTAFSWKTGRIENGAVHNPHYYEWFRTHDNIDRQNNNPCDDRPHASHILRHCNIVLQYDTENLNFFFRIMYQLNVHIHTVEIQQRFRPSERNNLGLRIRWLKNELNENTLGCLLHTRFKRNNVNIRRVQVYELFNTLSNDLFHRLLHCHTITHCNEIAIEFKQLITYTNQCFRNLASVYVMQMPYIHLISHREGRYEIDTSSNGYIKMRK
jgi:hypothetical protein